MIQEYWDSAVNYWMRNRVALSTVLTLYFLVAVVIYAWVRRVHGKPSRQDWRTVFTLIGIFAVPMSMVLVVALVISGLNKFYEFIFGT